LGFATRRLSRKEVQEMAAEATLTIEKRIEHLKERVRVTPELCVERGRLLTESMKETEGQPQLIRRALALQKILSGMSIGIHPYELIVGNVTSVPRGAPLVPEISGDWWETELDTFEQRGWDRIRVNEEIKEEVRAIARYWKGKRLEDQCIASMSEALRYRYRTYSSFAVNPVPLYQGGGRVSVDYEKAINRGLRTIQLEIRDAQASKHPGDSQHEAQVQFYQAASICIDAVIGFAARHGDLAERIAGEETSFTRKKELLHIADICRQVPASPARTFHEALQSLWFIQIGLLMEGFAFCFVPGQLDQYLWPYYERDLKEGLLTRSHAKDLLKFFFIKLNSYANLLSNNIAKYFTGFPMLQIITVGGTTADGKDATNELSYICLEADAEIGLTQPDTVVKVHDGMPDDLLLAACSVAKQCVGKLKFIGDEMAIRKLVNCGYPEADARRYVLIGCHEPFVQGNSHYWPGGHVSFAKCLEFALNNGQDRLTGRQVGLTTGDPRAFSSLDQVIEALFTQVRYFLGHVLETDEVMFRTVAEHWPTPFQSSLIRGCIRNGVDCYAKGAEYNFSWFSAGGLANVGDALAAIKKIVFEEHKISMAQLIDALDSNFAETPGILKMLKSAPKYGNDDDYVDLLVKDLAKRWCEEVQQHRVWDDIIAQAAVAIISGNIPYGAVVGATPDGRLAGEPLGEGGISPVQGRNTSGPTASIKSVAKIDHASMKSGSVFNMRFSPAALKNEESIRRFAALIKTYYHLGGFHIQFNIVDTDTLRRAQEHPDDYRDLLVRVATYTSYFTELGRELQDDIIERVECDDV